MRLKSIHWLIASGLLAMSAAVTATSCGGDDTDPGTDIPDGGESEASLQDRSSSKDGDPAGDGGADSKPPPTAIEACRAYVQAFCDRFVECGQPLGSCEVYFGLCPDYVLGNGSARTIDSVMACAQVRRNQACSEVKDGITPDCASAGTLPANAPCHFNQQCASYSCVGGGLGTCGYCSTPAAPDGGCGGNVTCGVNETCNVTCKPRNTTPALKAGDTCPADGGIGCQFDEPCSATTPQAEAGVCQGGAAIGAACRYRVSSAQALCDDSTCRDAGSPKSCSGPHALNEACGTSVGVDCQVGLYCDNAIAGTCKARRAANETCGVTAGRCLEEHYCAFTTATTGTCKPNAKIGEPCPNVPVDGGIGGYAVSCVTGAGCANIPGPTDGSTQRTCVATTRPGIGEPCDPPLRPCGGNVICNAQKKCELPTCLPKDAGAD
jgi:hypothetical protein